MTDRQPEGIGPSGSFITRDDDKAERSLGIVVIPDGTHLYAVQVIVRQRDGISSTLYLVRQSDATSFRLIRPDRASAVLLAVSQSGRCLRDRSGNALSFAVARDPSDSTALRVVVLSEVETVDVLPSTTGAAPKPKIDRARASIEDWADRMRRPRFAHRRLS